jgi:acetyltransferase-like isoleucine patch superfamily enzyme
LDVSEITGTWNYGSLPANVRLGRDCFVERRDAFARFRSERDPGLVLGDRVRVLTWTSFSIEPGGCVVVGDDALLLGAIFMCADMISVGARSIVQYNVTIADSDFHPVDVAARRRDAIASSPAGDRSQRPALVTRPVTIGEDVWIGTGAIILKGVTIGDRATIAPGAVVTRNVPADALAAGNPITITDK